jgi:hypothetical protein
MAGSLSGGEYAARVYAEALRTTDPKKKACIAASLCFYGGPCAIRTHDQQIKSLLLYQLS